MSTRVGSPRRTARSTWGAPCRCLPTCSCGPLAIWKAATLNVFPERRKPSITIAVSRVASVAFLAGRRRIAASQRYGVRASGRRTWWRARSTARGRTASTAAVWRRSGRRWWLVGLGQDVPELRRERQGAQRCRRRVPQLAPTFGARVLHLERGHAGGVADVEAVLLERLRDHERLPVESERLEIDRRPDPEPQALRRRRRVPRTSVAADHREDVAGGHLRPGGDLEDVLDGAGRHLVQPG